MFDFFPVCYSLTVGIFNELLLTFYLFCLFVYFFDYFPISCKTFFFTHYFPPFNIMHFTLSYFLFVRKFENIKL